uniref:Uncharacterized protein n=1 Tax=Rhizophora mucronata TaxID=61149 RepID=A0A2P2J8K0_RHIMU
MFIAPIAPAIPQLSLVTIIQDKSTSRKKEPAESHPTMLFCICACKYICMVRLKTKQYMNGMNHRETVPATSAMAGSWPSSLRIGAVKRNNGSNIVAVAPSTIHDRCR